MAFRPPLVRLAAVAAVLVWSGCSSNSSRPVRTYVMGDRVELGHMVYTVYETRWLTQIGDPGPNARIPQNRFLLVRMTAGTTETSEVFVPNMSVEDDSGKSYPEVRNGEGVPQWMGFLHAVSTDTPASGNVAFDVPPAHYKLHLADENSDNTATVDLPLTFRSDAPELPDSGGSLK